MGCGKFFGGLSRVFLVVVGFLFVCAFYVVESDCSGDGLGGLFFCVLDGVDRALETLTRRMVRIASMREREFHKKKAVCPLYLLLPCCGYVVRLRLCGRHRQTVPSDDDVLNVAAMGSGLDSCRSIRRDCAVQLLLMLTAGVRRAGFCVHVSLTSA